MASEIRVNQIQNRSGLSTVTFSDTGVVIAGITTISGNLNVTGSLSGSGSNGIVVGTGASISSPTSNVLALGTNNTEKVRITSSGNVGIGTTNPTSILHATAAANTTIIADTTSSSFDASIRIFGSGTQYAYFQAGPGAVVGGGANILTSQNIPLVFSTNNTERARITSTGNVGIGTNNPSFTLQVGSGNFNGGTSGFAFDTSYTAIFGTFGTGGNLTLRAQRISDTGGGDIFLGGSTRGDSNINSIVFSTANVERVRVNSSGNLGIGTNNPLTALHLVGTLRVDQNASDATQGSTNGIFPLADITLVNNASADVSLGSRFTGLVFVSGYTNDTAAAIFHIASASAFDDDTITRLTFRTHAAANTTDLTMSSKGTGASPQYQLTQTGTATKRYEIFAIGVYG